MFADRDGKKQVPQHFAEQPSIPVQDACEHSSSHDSGVVVLRALPPLDRPLAVPSSGQDMHQAWAQIINHWGLELESSASSRKKARPDSTHLKEEKRKEEFASKHNAEALTRRICSNLEATEDILEEAQPPSRRLTKILGSLLDLSQEAKAAEVLTWAETQDFLQSSMAYLYTRLFSGRVKLDRELYARDLYYRAKKAALLHDVISYNAMISALGKAGHLRLAQLVLSEMQESGFEPDVYTYTSMIKACQVCGCRWKLGLEYLQAMQARGLRPNVVTYTVLISCCQRAGQWVAGMRLFKELECQGLEIDIQIANSMISACAKGRRWEDAWAITSSMRNVGVLPDTRTYNALISACQRAGQAERALEVFGRMCKDAATREEAQPTIVTFNTLISACAKAGLYEKAQELFRDLRRRSLVPDAYTLSAIINACKQKDYWEEAIDIAKLFESRYGIQLNTIACNALITALGRAGRWQYAFQFYHCLESGELNGEPDGWTYAALILALRRSKQHAHVMNVFRKLQQEQLPVYKDTYFAALEACERLGLWNEGQDLLQSMQEDKQMLNVTGLDLAAWRTVFAFPPLMDSVPKPIIAAARVAVDSGRRARRLVKPKGKQNSLIM